MEKVYIRLEADPMTSQGDVCIMENMSIEVNGRGDDILNLLGILISWMSTDSETPIDLLCAFVAAHAKTTEITGAIDLTASDTDPQHLLYFCRTP